jgi:TATA-binding protein-associated factor Taf7
MTPAKISISVSILDGDELSMARGWESKAIADQIEEEESRQQQASNVETTREQRLLKERLDSLKLSRSRLFQQLERATHPAYRDVLRKGLKAVEKEIEEVSVEIL